jgi:hypothetical protein
MPVTKSQRYFCRLLNFVFGLAASHQFWNHFQIAPAECTNGLMSGCGIGVNNSSRGLRQSRLARRKVDYSVLVPK